MSAVLLDHRNYSIYAMVLLEECVQEKKHKFWRLAKKTNELVSKKRLEDLAATSANQKQ